MKLAAELQQELYNQGFKYQAPVVPPMVHHNYPADEGEPSENGPLKYTLSNWQDLHPDLDRNRPAPTPEAVKRILADYQELMKAKNPLIHVQIDEDDVTHVSALIIGPEDTPYSDGFFHFDMVYPHDYPWNPPKVTLVTTNNGTVRFNPNLYSNGKVCLSILGTWAGPSWTSVQTMYSTLISIQSLMNGAPYHNEPSYEEERNKGDVEAYNSIIQHETLRVAVCGMLERPTTEGMFMDEMREHFDKCFDRYLALAEKLGPNMDGKAMKDPFGEPRGRYNYKTISERLRALKVKFAEEAVASSAADTAAATEEKPVDPMDVVKDKEEPAAAPADGDITDPPKKKVKFNKDGQPAEPSLSASAGDSTAAVPAASSSAPAVSTSAVPAATTPAKPAINADFLSSILQNVASPAASSGSPAPPPGPIVLEAGDNLLTLDAQFAAALQAQFNSEAKPQPTKKWTGSQSPAARSTPGAKVKPPTKEELLKAEQNVADPDLVCLVCRQSPSEYISLPACSQPHTYCMACAGKLVKSVNSLNQDLRYLPPNISRALAKEKDKKFISCVLCKSVNFVDSAGIAPLRRIAKRKRQENAPLYQCPTHPRETAILFCTEYNQLCCPECLVSESHRKHRDDTHLAFDDAVEVIRKRLVHQVDSLRQKRGEHRDFSNKLTNQRPELVAAADAARVSAREKIESLKKMLDDKLAEMETQIKSIQTAREGKIDSELGKIQRRMDAFDQSLNLIEKVQSVHDPLSLLAQVEAADDELRTASSAPAPQSDPKWFKMPPVHIRLIEDSIRHVKYRESPVNPNSAAAFAELGIPQELLLGHEMEGEGEEANSSEGEEGMGDEYY